MKTQENLWWQKSRSFEKLGLLLSLWLGFAGSSWGQTGASISEHNCAIARVARQCQHACVCELSMFRELPSGHREPARTYSGRRSLLSLHSSVRACAQDGQKAKMAIVKNSSYLIARCGPSPQPRGA